MNTRKKQELLSLLKQYKNSKRLVQGDNDALIVQSAAKAILFKSLKQIKNNRVSKLFDVKMGVKTWNGGYTFKPINSKNAYDFFKQYGQEKYAIINSNDQIENIHGIIHGLSLSNIYPDGFLQTKLNDGTQSYINVKCGQQNKQFVVKNENELRTVMKQIQKWFDRQLKKQLKWMDSIYNSIKDNL